MKMNRRGVSPLIATILLVAIVIVIAFIVFWWYGDLIGKQLDKSKVDLEVVCIEDLDYSIGAVNCTSSTVPDNRVISFSVENTGSVRIGNFKVDGEGNTGNSFTKDIAHVVQPGVTDKVSFDLIVTGTNGIGKSIEFDVTPMVYGGGKTRYCGEKVQKVNVQCI